MAMGEAEFGAYVDLALAVHGQRRDGFVAAPPADGVTLAPVELSPEQWAQLPAAARAALRQHGG